MSLPMIMRAFYRWRALIFAVVLVTLLATGLSLYTAKPSYEAQVKLQLTTPQGEDVVLFDSYSSINAQDQTSIARANFSEILGSREVYARTSERLGLQGDDKNYTLDIRPLRDADYTYVAVRARTPQLAEQIANMHIAMAMEYYGEVRAKPATAAKSFLNQQLQSAEQALHEAEQALAIFKAANGITELDVDLNSYRDLLDQLQLERDRQAAQLSANPEVQGIEQVLYQLELERERAFAENNAQVVERYDQTIARYQAQLAEARKRADTTSGLNALIAGRRAELDRLIALQPRYIELQANIEQARRAYELLLDKYREAVLKENTVKTTGSIQIIEPALAPSEPVSTNMRMLLALALVGSLGLGMLLALALEYIIVFRAARLAIPGSTAVGSAEGTN